MLPIYDALASRTYSMVVWVMGSQMGKTEAMLNVIGWNFSDHLKPLLYVGPTEKNVRSMSLDRIAKMIRSTPVLWERLAKGQRNKVTEKWIGGARFGLGWGSSATELASHPAAVALVDELDRMGADVGGEGDPVELVSGRLKNYRGSKLGITSTPTIEHASAIWARFEEGTMGMWAWECPHCSGWFIPRLDVLVYQADGTLDDVAASASVVCRGCGAALRDDDKPRLNARGRMVYHGKPNPDDPMRPLEPSETPRPSATASFWVSGLCSPWVTFGGVARRLEAAQRSREQTRIQGVVNVWGGETFRVIGDRPEWQEVQACAGAYELGEIPHGVQVLTMGVDVQRDRLYFGIRGWGHQLESWLIQRGEVLGRTDYDDTWIRLGNYIKQAYGSHVIARVGVDSGYKPGSEYRRPESIIYSFARRFPGVVFPTKGYASMSRPVNLTPIQSEGCTLITFDSDHFKSHLYALVRWPQADPGAWHVPRDIDEDYCRQMVAEEVVITPAGKRVWVDHRRPNHYFDVEVINLVLARTLNLEALPTPEEQQAETKRRIAAQFPETAPAPSSAGAAFKFYD